MHKITCIILLLYSLIGLAQRDTSRYDRREEIIDKGKRYRIHNNYLSFGAGYASSSLWINEQAIIGIDFNFHIRRQYFNSGIYMSGNRFLSNNNVGAHLGYGYRKENEKYNFAFYAGPSYNEGVIPPQIKAGDTLPAKLYKAFGLYANIHYIYKLTYDIGIGGELFADFNQVRRTAGIKLIMFFSGAYQGKAKIYNKYVRKPKKS